MLEFPLTRDQAIAMMSTDFGAGTVQELRALIAQASSVPRDLPEVGALHERIPLRETAGEALTADVVLPRRRGPHPVVLYLHGGGWSICSPGTHADVTHALAHAGFLTVGLDYRLAPEHPYPAALDDCVFAADWIRETIARFGGDPTRLAIGGDSAGANLTATTILALGRRGRGPAPRAAVLLYGVYDVVELARPEFGFPRGPAMAADYAGSDPVRQADPLVSPLRAPAAELARFPPTFVTAGSLDPLAVQSEALAAALRPLGVEVELRLYPGVPHAFYQFPVFEEQADAQQRVHAFLRHHLG